MKYRFVGTSTVLLALLPLLAGCGEKPAADITREAFAAISEDAVSLYTRLHPLRASRLGLEGADSLLFTFSPDEIERAMEAIDTMMAAVLSLAADDLDDGRIDESVLLSDWMKGERFVFTRSRTCLDNPLLFCWMIEEALWGIPTRPRAPDEGERRAWGARISRLPALVENASGLLRKPGGIHLEKTAERLQALSAGMPLIARIAEERYGEPVAELERARAAIDKYMEIIDGFRGDRSSSRQIMGLEELSWILQYSEHIDFDPSAMIDEAEKITRRLSRQLVPGDIKVNDPGAGQVTVSEAVADSLLKGIEEGLASRHTFGLKKNPRSPVKGYEGVWKPMRLPVNPYLCLPSIPETDIRWDFGAGKNGDCVPSVLVPDRREYSLDQLKYDLLIASSLMSAPDRKMCLDRSPVRKIFGVETFRYAWKAHNSTDLTGLIPERRMQLTQIQTVERVFALARMILVFRLHSGQFTSEAAMEYLEELLPFDPARIEAEVILASVSPVSSFEGMAFMTVETMVKQATIDRQGGKPREMVRQLLLDSAGMPPYLLMTRASP